MTEATRVTFTPTLDDTLAAFDAATRLPWWRAMIAGLLFGALLGCAGYLQTVPRYDWAAAVFGAVAFPIGWTWFTRRKVRQDVGKAFANQPALSEHRTVCWDQTGLSWSADLTNRHIPWNAFIRSQQTRHAILFWRERKRFEFLPMRVLTPENLATLQPFLIALHK